MRLCLHPLACARFLFASKCTLPFGCSFPLVDCLLFFLLLFVPHLPGPTSVGSTSAGGSEACHYVCVQWAEETTVTKLLELGMVVGGGMAIVMGADIIGASWRKKQDSLEANPLTLWFSKLGPFQRSFLVQSEAQDCPCATFQDACLPMMPNVLHLVAVGASNPV